jgi:hypothetical protein
MQTIMKPVVARRRRSAPTAMPTLVLREKGPESVGAKVGAGVLRWTGVELKRGPSRDKTF